MCFAVDQHPGFDRPTVRWGALLGDLVGGLAFNVQVNEDAWPGPFEVSKCDILWSGDSMG